MRYKTKPVIVEAERWTDWDNPPAGVYRYEHHDDHGLGGVPDPEGIYVDCQLGDWIITEAKGNCFPCKPFVFDATYEPVDN